MRNTRYFAAAAATGLVGGTMITAGGFLAQAATTGAGVGFGMTIAGAGSVAMAIGAHKTGSLWDKARRRSLAESDEIRGQQSREVGQDTRSSLDRGVEQPQPEQTPIPERPEGWMSVRNAKLAERNLNDGGGREL